MYGKERSNNMIGDIRKFKFWCQKVLPLVYDDSLSYYEVLCKIVQYLNKVIEDVNSIPEYIDAVIDEKLSDEHIIELISQFVLNIEGAISSNNEGENTNSSSDYNVGQMLWWNNKLYKVIRTIEAGDTLIAGTNLELVNFEDLYNDFIAEVKHDITPNDDGVNTTASVSWDAGTWLWLNDELYKAVTNIVAGNAYVFTGDGKNVEKINIEGEINNEATTREEADTALQTAIGEEATAREEADTALQTAIGDEATAREEADTALQTAIDDEATARENGDNELREYVDELVLFKSLKEYPASGLNTIAYGDIVTGTNELTLRTTNDYSVGNGLLVKNAGPITTLTPPTNFSASYSGTAGNVTHVYSLCKFDNKFSCTPCVNVSVSGCATELDENNLVNISFDTDPNAYGFLLYKDNVLVDILSPNILGSVQDWQLKAITAPFNVPSTPPTDYVSGYLKTVVTAIDGQTLTIRDNANYSVSNSMIVHDDTEAIQKAFDNNHRIYIPEGTYNVSITAGVWCLSVPSNIEIFGVKGASVLNSLFSIAHGAMLFNSCNVVGGTNNNIKIHDLSVRTNYNKTIAVCGISFRLPAIYMAKNTIGVKPTNIEVSNIEISGVSGGITFAGIVNGIIEHNDISSCIADGCGCYDDCDNSVIQFNNIYDTGDDCIGISNAQYGYNTEIKCIGNKCVRTGAHGIRVEGVGHYVAGNYVEYTNLSGIFVHKYVPVRTDGCQLIGNCVLRVGEYTGGVAGNHPETPYDVLLADDAGENPIGFLSQIAIIGNELNDTNAIHLLGSNDYNVITNIQIGNNPTIAGGSYDIEGVLTPNNIHSFTQRMTGSVEVEVTTADTLVVTPIVIPALPLKPVVTITPTNGVSAGNIDYWVTQTSKTGFRLVVIAANPATYTFDWCASC